MLENHMRARHHVDARRHHGGGVDQRGNWRWAFHGIREPYVQGNLRRLSASAHHQKNANRSEQPCAGSLWTLRSNTLKHLIKIQRPKMLDQQKKCDHESEVADAVDDESFLSCRCR